MNLNRQGCVYLDIIQIYKLSIAGSGVRTVAQHIYDTQVKLAAYNFPGAGFPLIRMVNKPDEERNRRAALRMCGKGKRPTGMECDEYPFAATYEGCITGIFRFLKVVCDGRLVIGSENSLEGFLRNRFWNDYRVLHDDPFYVQITP